ncbi:MAG: transcription elongation factor NusA [Candidatus Diapherotrites archaeon]|nr:transcription elongation factor NusA [Candidatus Diapherotrites archaeon]
MKGPLCEECVKSGILCDGCAEKQRNGEIGELDIQLARLLQKLEQRDLVRGASFERIFDINGLLVITTKGKVGPLVGKGGRVIRLLSKEFNRKVRVVSTLDDKTALRDLVAPARIQGINIVYKPGGEETKAIISREDKYKLITNLETLQKAANTIMDKAVVLEVK